jgi:fatty acid desaturase
MNAAATVLARTPDDAAMLRAAVDLSRDISEPKASIYWPDMLASALLGYAAMVLTMVAGTPVVAIGAALVAIFALYRADAFIHELTHIRQGTLPGFRLGWNLIVGIPLLMPSFLYEGVHTQHHQRTRYGTAQDPEYLPLALMKPWTLPLFILASILAPVGLFLRFAVLTPLSFLIPPLRAKVVASYSALSINPAYRRRPAEGAFRKLWLWQEIGASLWCLNLLADLIAGVLPLRAFVIYLGIISGIAVINQVRTLVAHLWENEGETMTVTGQYLDSVNVPPPGLWAYLWAPVGLRYHALHHLLPSVPYHALGEAHRRLSKALDVQSPYHRASYPGLFGLVARIARSTMVRGGHSSVRMSTVSPTSRNSKKGAQAARNGG